jgi:hypothetical protein
MKALDKWIAREVFGYKAVPGFTTNISCSFLLLNKFAKWRWKIEKIDDGYKVSLNDVECISSTPELAICEAAYLYLERKHFISDEVAHEEVSKKASPKFVVDSCGK